MKPGRSIISIAFILTLIGSLTWAACSNQPDSGSGLTEPVVEANADPSHSQDVNVSEPSPSPAATQTRTPPPTHSIPPTLTPPPTRTKTPTPRPTSTPTFTPTPVIISDNVNRTCPNPSPLRPEYDRYYVPAQSWPLPDNSGIEHFWLSHPFEGGGRLLYTDWFPYGYDAGGRYLIHNGLDVSEPLGTPILAMADGTVVVAGDDYGRLYGWRCDWYGHLVVIELDDTWLDQPVYILYGHVLEISVEVGQHIERGEQVAEVGIGGAATLPHLHFEVRVGTNEFGSTRNPLLWMTPSVTRGLVAGRVVDPEGRPWQGVAVNAFGVSEGTENYTTWSYLGDPQDLIKPDEVLAENFVIGDMRPGQYEIIILLQGTEYRAVVEVEAGGVSTVEIVTEPVKTATPEPTSTVSTEQENSESTPQPEN